MKKVTAFIGSARKKHTYDAANRLLEYIRSSGGVETEVVLLSDFRLETCRGCKVCFLKGEEYCPHKDDRDLLIEKIEASDGIVLATPNYSFQVSAIMKIFLDRLGFMFHRPRFFGKTFTSITAQGIYGGNKIKKYLDFVGKGLGFNTVKGSCFTALEPMSGIEKEKFNKMLKKQSERFLTRLMKPAYPAPKLIMLIGFRSGRTSIKLELDESYRDYLYYQEKGWFESSYFYPVRMSAFKNFIGNFFDTLQARATRKRKRG